MSGPWRKHTADAIAAWNRRAGGEREQQLEAENERLRAALQVPEVWSEIERDGMASAFKLADGKRGHYETLFAVAAWLLRYRAALTGQTEGERNG